MMQSVALTDSGLFPDDDFVVVPFVDTTNDVDDDDSYDYCDDVLLTSFGIEITAGEEGACLTPGSVSIAEESFSHALGVTSLVLSGIVEMESSVNTAEIRSSQITGSILEATGSMMAQLEENMTSMVEHPVEERNQSKNSLEERKDFGENQSGFPSPIGTSCLDEVGDTRTSSPSSTTRSPPIHEPTSLTRSHPSKTTTSAPSDGGEDEEASLPDDPREEAILQAAEEVENNAWPSRCKQRRLTNKKRRKKMKLARKAAAAAAGAALVSHRTSIPTTPATRVALQNVQLKQTPVTSTSAQRN